MKTNISEELVWAVDNDIQKMGTFITFMATSGILTSVALLTNSVPVLIGAMVVAPLLAPLQLIAFGFVSGHFKLVAKGLGVSIIGLLTALIFTALTTFLMNKIGIIEETSNLIQKPLLEERVRPGAYSILVAIASGVAGTLAIAKKKMDTLIGVVASIALVPALGAATIAFISHDNARAIGGFILFLVNYMIIIGVGIMLLAIAGRKLSTN